VNWQIRYALASFKEERRSTAEHVEGDVIKIVEEARVGSHLAHPNIVQVLDFGQDDSGVYYLVLEWVDGLDFLCGYRSQCVWEGKAIQYLEQNRVGWGNFGTLCSAALDGNANSAPHKVYKFSYRLLLQHRLIATVDREFDRIHRITLLNGATFRIGMIADYEPTAENVRALWERFGPVDIVWNTNPNGSPPPEACGAGRELGCEVIKWDELKERLSEAL